MNHTVTPQAQDADKESDARLNAYVDGELDSSECAYVLLEASRNPDTRNAIADLQQVKDLLRNAYPRSGLRVAQNTDPAPSAFGQRQCVAYPMLVLVGLSVGALAGWFARDPVGTWASAGTPQVLAVHPDRRLLHIEQNDPKILLALQVAVDRLPHAGKGSHIIVNREAVLLFAAGNPDGEAFLQHLHATHPTVGVILCRQSHDRFLRTSGQVPARGVSVAARTAVEEIVEQVRDGVGYERITY